MKCKYCTEPYNENFIVETQNWYIYIAPQKYSLGRCLVVLKRHHNDMSQLKAQEKIELSEIIKRVEKAILSLYKPQSIIVTSPTDINHKIVIPNAHIHWHLKPVYKDKQIYAQYTNFYLSLKKFLPVSKEVRLAILKDIQQYLLNSVNSPIASY